MILPPAFQMAAVLSAALGLLVLWPGAPSRLLVGHAESAANGGTASHRGWMLVSFLGAAGFWVLVKWWQYRSGQLPEDTAALANVAFNIWDHLGWETSVFGLPSYFAIHFMPIIALFAPIGRLAGACGMLCAQAAVLVAAPFAVYALVRLKTGSTSAGLAALWLALTSPLFFLAARASLAPQVCLPAFLLWAVYCAETRRLKAAAAFCFLGALCTEQAPLVFAGAGVYLVARGPRRLAGAAVVAASALVWLFEWRVIHSYPHPYDFWGAFFARLGASPRAALGNAARHPLAVAATVLWPPENLSALWKALWSTGLLPLAAPFELLPFAVAFAPHLAAEPSSFYHSLDLHYAAYVLAPLYWALACGAATAFSRLRERGLERLLPAAALLVGGLNLRHAPQLIMPRRGPQLFWSMPELAPRVPPEASVWVLEYAAAQLAFRRDLQIIYGDGAIGKPGAVLFKPDYILIDVSYLLEPYKEEQRARTATFLSREKYGVQAATPTMYLLRRKEVSKPGEAPETLGALPAADKSGLAYVETMRQMLLEPLRKMNAVGGPVGFMPPQRTP